MKERPILFSGAMVRALLAGTKTQTRRVVKVEPPPGAERVIRPFRDERLQWAATDPHDMEQGQLVLGEAPRCPYGVPGDRLWVRETFQIDAPRDGTWHDTQWYGCKGSLVGEIPERFQHPRFCNFAADWLHGQIKWRPGIHMPRWASRITLEVTGVRVERLKDISADDAKAEGITEFIGGWWSEQAAEDRAIQAGSTPQEGYRHLWEQINGAGSWDLNPWVWCVNFKALS